MKFERGDIVKVIGITGPRMLVTMVASNINGTPTAPDVVYVSWFDVDFHSQTGSFPADVLEKLRA